MEKHGQGWGGESAMSRQPHPRVHSSCEAPQRAELFPFRLSIHPCSRGQGGEGKLRTRGGRGLHGGRSCTPPPPTPWFPHLHLPCRVGPGWSWQALGHGCHRLADQWGFQWAGKERKRLLKKPGVAFASISPKRPENTASP